MCAGKGRGKGGGGGRRYVGLLGLMWWRRLGGEGETAGDECEGGGDGRWGGGWLWVWMEIRGEEGGGEMGRYWNCWCLVNAVGGGGCWVRYGLR